MCHVIPHGLLTCQSVSFPIQPWQVYILVWCIWNIYLRCHMDNRYLININLLNDEWMVNLLTVSTLPGWQFNSWHKQTPIGSTFGSQHASLEILVWLWHATQLCHVASIFAFRLPSFIHAGLPGSWCALKSVGSVSWAVAGMWAGALIMPRRGIQKECPNFLLLQSIVMNYWDIRDSLPSISH